MRYLREALRETYHHNLNQHDAYGWTLERHFGGANGIVYRATHKNPKQAPLALKMSRRDARQRTLRDFTALLALHKAKISAVCPFPIIYYDDLDDLPGNVLVSEWLAGQPLQGALDEGETSTWEAILLTFARVHSLTGSQAALPLKPAVLSIQHPIDLLAAIRERRQRLPLEGCLGCLSALELDQSIADFYQTTPHYWAQPVVPSLILCDPNPLNMILHEGTIKFVDWENSGWSDPALDIADWLARPTSLHLSAPFRLWLMTQYAKFSLDRSAPERIEVYARLMALWWLVISSEAVVHGSQEKLRGTLTYSQTVMEAQQATYWGIVQAL